MKTVTGVFGSAADAQRAMGQMRTAELREDRVTLLTPGSEAAKVQTVPTVSTEQPGMGKAIGALLGGAAGLSAGPLIVASLIPGVGPITAMGLLAGAFVGAAGAGAGAAVGGRAENAMTDGLPEDEMFVYEDALRKGRSVLIASAEDENEAERFRELLKAEGAEEVDAAREQWWIGLRGAEQEHYLPEGRKFGDDEKFYRMGFESALHARTRCKEYDQVMGEMTAQIEDLEREHPGVNVAEPFQRGYERGRDYYQHLCDEKKAA
ncbi:MAG: hypothetical protein WAL56_05165 [Candidatus Sulfotelmatobacter sp.]